MPRQMIIGISEVVLNVADLGMMRQFYTDVLGFELVNELSMENEIADPGGEPTICFLKVCDSDTPLGRDRHPPMLVLIDYRRHVFARRRVTGHDVTRSTLNHIAFEIPAESLDGEAARIAALDIQVTHSEFPDLNARAVFFQDPEGNVLELICRG